MKVLVTGATGYFGHELAAVLARRGHQVQVLVRNPASPHIPSHPNVSFFQGDILDADAIDSAMAGCEAVFHTAAFVGLYSVQGADIFDVNVNGTVNLLKSAVKHGVRDFIFTSTCGVIGTTTDKPLQENDAMTEGFANDYDLSKHLAEQKVKEFSKKGLHTVIINASKIFGPGNDRHSLSVNQIIKRYASGKVCFCPSPMSYQANYVFIGDLIDGHILGWRKGRPGENYIIGSANLSYKEIFNALKLAAGREGIVLAAPEWVAGIYGYVHYFFKKLAGGQPFFSGNDTKNLYCNKVYSIQKAIDELGYKPSPMLHSLKKTIDYFDEERDRLKLKNKGSGLKIYPNKI